ncbi:hypothetical protein [Flavobacterium caeni]|uniref:GLPGLI family protein n=1 Tax=Flavobacterium caeni TaxID=490189 RepID=A0A1G5GW54_9FLAO|nr:hypothetical protein [Flavobacterium caeni]SCY55786.1 hypothetical protein SAMN02927903_01653 [Flavobacterium caeni]
MKTIFILFTSLFTVMFHAQNNHYAKSAMVVLVTEANKSFAKNMTFDNWKKQQLGTAARTTAEDNFLKDVYRFLDSDASPENIFKNYDGASLVALAKSTVGPGALSVSAERCGFWCQLFAYFFTDYRSYIQEIVFP